jgi:hypothetical protein
MDNDAEVSVHAAALYYFLGRNVPRVEDNGRCFACRPNQTRTCDKGSILDHAARDAPATSDATMSCSRRDEAAALETWSF